ncbi:proteasome subunit beta [Pseudomonas syringae]|uniref:proteasome subunit beta n=1 Tax=Pseudomonas syringae TaxID=317 RepID=UPI001F081FD5|nr:proteasome subunit beta [Pseudomonas syringae]
MIAYDSRSTRGTTITDDDCEKLQTVNGVEFLCTGCACDFDALIAGYFGTVASSQVEASGYAIDDGKLFLIGYDDKTGSWKSALDLDRVDAIGSGSPFALTAMDMGSTAAEAVEMAKKRDTGTGGQVRLLVIAQAGVPQG